MSPSTPFVLQCPSEINGALFESTILGAWGPKTGKPNQALHDRSSNRGLPLLRNREGHWLGLTRVRPESSENGGDGWGCAPSLGSGGQAPSLEGVGGCPLHPSCAVLPGQVDSEKTNV
jgi:hypothetical protein